VINVVSYLLVHVAEPLLEPLGLAPVAVLLRLGEFLGLDRASVLRGLEEGIP